MEIQLNTILLVVIGLMCLYIIGNLKNLAACIDGLVNVLKEINLSKNLTSQMTIGVNVDAENAKRELVAIDERVNRIVKNVDLVNSKIRGGIDG